MTAADGPAAKKTAGTSTPALMTGKSPPSLSRFLTQKITSSGGQTTGDTMSVDAWDECGGGNDQRQWSGLWEKSGEQERGEGVGPRAVPKLVQTRDPRIAE